MLQASKAISGPCLLQKGEFHKLADAKILLSDCLACDSCVTTEEGARVSQQNTQNFFHVLNLNKVGVVPPQPLGCGVPNLRDICCPSPQSRLPTSCSPPACTLSGLHGGTGMVEAGLYASHLLVSLGTIPCAGAWDLSVALLPPTPTRWAWHAVPQSTDLRTQCTCWHPTPCQPRHSLLHPGEDGPGRGLQNLRSACHREEFAHIAAVPVCSTSEVVDMRCFHRLRSEV